MNTYAIAVSNGDSASDDTLFVTANSKKDARKSGLSELERDFEPGYSIVSVSKVR